MKVDVAGVNDVEKRMTVCIFAEVVDGEIEKTYKGLKKEVKIKGFRPGKVPLAILKKHFKAQVEEDVISKLVSDSYPKALEEAKEMPVSPPKIENGVIEQGKDFTYTAVFEVKPEIDVKDYEGLELEKEKVEISDEDVDKEIETLRNSHAALKEVEGRPVQKGDNVLVDYEGTVAGEPLPQGKQQNFPMEISEDTFLPGFSDQITGMNKGEKKTFSINLPEDYGDENISGKKADFTLTLNEIKEKVLPELDDEFAKDLGDYKGLQELKDKFKESMLERKTQKSESDVREKIFDVLIEKNSFDVPKKMVESQAKNMVMEMQQMFAAQGMNLGDMGQSPEQLIESYKQPAEKQLRSALLLEAIAKKENLDADQSEIEAKYEDLAKQVGQDVAFVKEKVTDDMIKPQVLEKKALDLIISKANFTEK